MKMAAFQSSVRINVGPNVYTDPPWDKGKMFQSSVRINVGPNGSTNADVESLAESFNPP